MSLQYLILARAGGLKYEGGVFSGEYSIYNYILLYYTAYVRTCTCFRMTMGRLKSNCRFSLCELITLLIWILTTTIYLCLRQPHNHHKTRVCSSIMTRSFSARSVVVTTTIQGFFRYLIAGSIVLAYIRV